MKPSTFIMAAAGIILMAVSPGAFLVVALVVGGVLAGQKIKALREAMKPAPMVEPMPFHVHQVRRPLPWRRADDTLSIEEREALQRRLGHPGI